jgi:hypothetical protein
MVRFEHKLWNALALTRAHPHLYAVVGVKWVKFAILKVHRDIFGRFINVTRPAAALYNRQGAFAAHRFLEIAVRQVQGLSNADREDIDESVVRLFKHKSDEFTMHANEQQLSACRFCRIGQRASKRRNAAGRRDEKAERTG